MKNKVLYFSRSGNSKRIADKVAKKIGCETIEITDNVSWKGIFGFVKGGYYSLHKKVTKISLENDYNPAEADNIILVVPLWAGGTAPAGYSFLQNEIGHIKNLYFIVSSDGSAPDKAFLKLEAMVGSIKNKYGIIKNKKNEDDVVNIVCASVEEI